MSPKDRDPIRSSYHLIESEWQHVSLQATKTQYTKCQSYNRQNWSLNSSSVKLQQHKDNLKQQQHKGSIVCTVQFSSWCACKAEFDRKEHKQLALMGLNIIHICVEF